MEKISVIIPAYNSENTITNTIQSVLNQKKSEFNIEIIIINDGSSDSTGLVCDNLARDNNIITVIHQANKGVSFSRRKGLSISTGDYCVFLDSDDYWDNDFLYNLKPFINGAYDLVMFNFKRVNSSNKIVGVQQLFKDKVEFTENNKDELYKLIARGTGLNNLVTKIFKRNIFVEKAYKDFYSISNGEDLLEVLTLIDNATRIIYVNQAGYNYMNSENSLSNSFNIDYYKNLFLVRNEVKNFFIKNNAFNQEIEYEFSKFYLEKMMDYIQNLFSHSNLEIHQHKIVNEIKNNSLFKEAVAVFDGKFTKYKNRILYFLFLNEKYELLKLTSVIISNLKKVII